MRQSKLLRFWSFLLVGVAVIAGALFQLPIQAQQAADLHCNITSVHDGDSLRVRCPGYKKTIPIRLSQIDAPELQQAYGIQSRNHLRSVCPVGAAVIVKNPSQDQYQRTLGEVLCNGTDVNTAMLESGSAWVYDQYVHDRSLYALQDSARSQKLGLWANSKAQAPWLFRRKNK